MRQHWVLLRVLGVGLLQIGLSSTCAGTSRRAETSRFFNVLQGDHKGFLCTDSYKCAVYEMVPCKGVSTTCAVP